MLWPCSMAKGKEGERKTDGHKSNKTKTRDGLSFNIKNGSKR